MLQSSVSIRGQITDRRSKHEVHLEVSTQGNINCLITSVDAHAYVGYGTVTFGLVNLILLEQVGNFTLPQGYCIARHNSSFVPIFCL